MFSFSFSGCHPHLTLTLHRVVVFVDEDNGDVDDIPSDGEGLDGDDETSDESEADSSDVSESRCASERNLSLTCH